MLNARELSHVSFAIGSKSIGLGGINQRRGFIFQSFFQTNSLPNRHSSVHTHVQSDRKWHAFAVPCRLQALNLMKGAEKRTLNGSEIAQDFLGVTVSQVGCFD